jgi:hypothetical protein
MKIVLDKGYRGYYIKYSCTYEIESND